MGIFHKRHAPINAPPAVDFVKLANAASEGQRPPQELWDAVFVLEHWHFIGVGELPDVRPLVATVEGKTFLMAYTDGQLANRAAHDNGLQNNGAAAVLCLPTSAAATLAARYIPSGVMGIMFNRVKDTQAFFAPLTNVLPMYQWAHRRLPPGVDPDLLAVAFDFRAAMRGARAAGEAKVDALIATVLLLEQWVAWVSPHGDGLPLVLESEPGRTTFLFADTATMKRAEDEIFASSDAQHERMIVKAPDALSVLGKLREGGVTLVSFNLSRGGGGFELPIDVCISAIRKLRGQAS